MPHLSPMNWSLAIMFLWVILLSTLTLTFFLKPIKFLQPKHLFRNSTSKPWLW